MNSTITTLSITPLPKPPPPGILLLLEAKSVLSLHFPFPSSLPRLLQPPEVWKLATHDNDLEQYVHLSSIKSKEIMSRGENPNSVDCRYSALESLNQNEISCLASPLSSLRTILHYALILSIALGHSKDVLLRIPSSVASYSIVPKVPEALELSLSLRVNRRSRVFVANGHNVPTISDTLESLKNEALNLCSNFFSLSSKSGFASEDLLILNQCSQNCGTLKVLVNRRVNYRTGLFVAHRLSV